MANHTFDERNYFFGRKTPDGSYTAKALGASIFTEADSLEELKTAIQDAVKCHFDDPDCAITN